MGWTFSKQENYFNKELEERKWQGKKTKQNRRDAGEEREEREIVRERWRVREKEKLLTKQVRTREKPQ